MASPMPCRLFGYVYDADCSPLPNCLIRVWIGGSDGAIFGDGAVASSVKNLYTDISGCWEALIPQGAFFRVAIASADFDFVGTAPNAESVDILSPTLSLRRYVG